MSDFSCFHFSRTSAANIFEACTYCNLVSSSSPSYIRQIPTEQIRHGISLQKSKTCLNRCTMDTLQDIKSLSTVSWAVLLNFDKNELAVPTGRLRRSWQNVSIHLPWDNLTAIRPFHSHLHGFFCWKWLDSGQPWKNCDTFAPHVASCKMMCATPQKWFALSDVSMAAFIMDISFAEKSTSPSSAKSFPRKLIACLLCTNQVRTSYLKRFVAAAATKFRERRHSFQLGWKRFLSQSSGKYPHLVEIKVGQVVLKSAAKLSFNRSSVSLSFFLIHTAMNRSQRCRMENQRDKQLRTGSKESHWKNCWTKFITLLVGRHHLL